MFHPRRVRRHALAGLLLLLCPSLARAEVLRDDLWVTNGGIFATAILGNTLYLGGSFTRVGPATGGFMPVSSTTGAPTLPPRNVDGSINAMAADGAGGWFIGGSFSNVLGQPRANLARIDGAGELLPWNPGCDGVVKTMAIAGTTLYLGGSFGSVAGDTRNNLAAVDVNTAALKAWDPNTNDIVHTLAISNGLVYVGGAFFAIAGTQRAYGAALNATTGAATPWEPNADGDIRAIVVRYDVINLTTTVYMGGSFTVIGGQFRNNLAAVDATVGSANFSTANAFNPSPNGAVRALRIIGNTIPTLYVGGDFTTIAGQSRNYLASFSGSTLRTWNPSPDNNVQALSLNGSDILVGGNFSTLGGQPRPYAGAVSTTSGLATAWNPSPNGPARAFGASGTTLWLGGDFTSLGGVARSNLAALDLASGQATAWNPGTDGPVYAMKPIGGLLYAGGTFSSVGGQARGNVAQLDAAGNIGGWNPGANNSVYALAGRALDFATNVVYMAGAFTTVSGQTRNRLAAVTDEVIPTLSSWNPNANGSVNALAVAASAVYVGGSFTSMNNQSIQYLGRVDFAGTPQPWIPNPQAAVKTVVVSGSKVYVGFVGQAVIGGAIRGGVAELDATTAQASLWNPDCNGVVYAIRLKGSTIYLGGLFDMVGGQNRLNLAEVDATSGAATAFNPSPTSFYTQLGLHSVLPGIVDLSGQSGRLYAAGQFTSILGKPHSAIAGMFESSVAVEPLVPGSALALRATPNPSSGGQAFAVNLPTASEARVEIHDLAGRLVRVLSRGVMPAGPARIEWDGLGESGMRVAPGLYFARLEADGKGVTAKVLRAR